MLSEYRNPAKEREEIPPSVALYQMMTGYWISRAISVAAVLVQRIFKLIFDMNCLTKS